MSQRQKIYSIPEIVEILKQEFSNHGALAMLGLLDRVKYRSILPLTTISEVDAIPHQYKCDAENSKLMLAEAIDWTIGLRSKDSTLLRKAAKTLSEVSFYDGWDGPMTMYGTSIQVDSLRELSGLLKSLSANFVDILNQKVSFSNCSLLKIFHFLLAPNLTYDANAIYGAFSGVVNRRDFISKAEEVKFLNFYSEIEEGFHFWSAALVVFHPMEFMTRSVEDIMVYLSIHAKSQSPRWGENFKLFFKAHLSVWSGQIANYSLIKFDNHDLFNYDFFRSFLKCSVESSCCGDFNAMIWSTMTDNNMNTKTIYPFPGVELMRHEFAGNASGEEVKAAVFEFIDVVDVYFNKHKIGLHSIREIIVACPEKKLKDQIFEKWVNMQVLSGDFYRSTMYNELKKSNLMTNLNIQIFFDGMVKRRDILLPLSTIDFPNLEDDLVDNPVGHFDGNDDFNDQIALDLEEIDAWDAMGELHDFVGFNNV